MRGLEGGADYYLSKPFQTPELIACLRAITRRKSDKPLMRLCFGGIELQQESVSLLCARTGQSVKLGAKEYQLLELFLRNPRQVLPRETIVECVWGFDNEAEYNKSGGLPVLCAPQAAIRRLDRGNSRHARRGLRIGGGRMLETLRRRLTWLVIGILVLISAGLIASTGADKNALLVTGGNVTVTDSKLVRESADSTGGDSASFYGVGAAALVTGGTLTMETAEISTDAEGGAGVFACGSGVATVKNTVISTRRGTSGGVHVAGGRHAVRREPDRDHRGRVVGRDSLRPRRRNDGRERRQLHRTRLRFSGGVRHGGYFNYGRGADRHRLRSAVSGRQKQRHADELHPVRQRPRLRRK